MIHKRPLNRNRELSCPLMAIGGRSVNSEAAPGGINRTAEIDPKRTLPVQKNRQFELFDPLWKIQVSEVAGKSEDEPSKPDWEKNQELKNEKTNDMALRLQQSRSIAMGIQIKKYGIGPRKHKYK
ncbi:MAG: hypothetical protein OEO83_16975 [Alphaproteobacteria bacterium]|nr:hypothetical protein [Alphaproteobacteria bacterium]